MGSKEFTSREDPDVGGCVCYRSSRGPVYQERPNFEVDARMCRIYNFRSA
jgi:hypothetical protein